MSNTSIKRPRVEGNDDVSKENEDRTKEVIVIDDDDDDDEVEEETKENVKENVRTVVYVLVRTEDRSDRVPDWECHANTQVAGVYTSRDLAERMKRQLTKHMDSNDDENYTSGECFVTNFQIFEEVVHNDVIDYDGDGDGDY